MRKKKKVNANETYMQTVMRVSVHIILQRSAL